MHGQAGARYLWTQGLTPPRFPALPGDVETPVLVIGGGLAGVLCSLRLQQAGVEHLLVEGGRIGQGITKGTTAVLTAQQDTLYQDMIRRHGREMAALYLQANCRAVEQYRRLAAQFPCDFETLPSVMYSVDDAAKMQQEAAAVRSLGLPARFQRRTAMPFPVAGAVLYPGMAQFHPLKFLYAAARNLPIYEDTFVERLEGTTAVTRRGRIRAQKVIVATHFPFINRRGLYFMKLYQQRSYVVALQGAPAIGCTIEDVRPGGIYLRNYGGLLLVGGGSHRTGKQKPGQGFAAPRDFAEKYYPQAKEVAAWANQDTVPLDGVPYIGPYSSAMPQVFVATGFNLWGMTTSMVAANILCDAVCGRENPYAAAFRPQRTALTGQLFANLGQTLLTFVTPTAPRCPHLGCALKWNAAEHSWDCPCHGSRFDRHGRLQDNPAMKNIRCN